MLGRLREISYHELAQVIVMWMQRLTSPVTRRAPMSKLSAAFTVAAAAPLSDVLNPDERDQVTRVVHGAADFNEPHCVTAPKWSKLLAGKATHSVQRSPRRVHRP